MTSIDTKPQQKIDGFFGFTNRIADLAKKRSKTCNGMSTSDILGLTSKNLLTSIELQQYVDLRNTLQQLVGEIYKYLIKHNSGVKLLTEVCKERQTKRFVSPHKESFHLPILCDSVSVVTPIKQSHNTNSRWYRNNLSESPLPKQQ